MLASAARNTCQHKVDPVRRRASIHVVFGAGFNAPNLEQPPPPTGLGLAATDLEELSTLVNNRTPVTIID